MTQGALAIVVLGIAFMMNALARGVSETYAVFLLPLGAEFGWNRSQLTSVYSIYMLVHGIAAPLAGILFDRLGARVTYGVGIACLGGGYFLAGRLESLWQFYLCVSLLGGIGVAAMGMVSASVLVSRWFRARLATAMGIAYTGLGFGLIAVVPLTELVIEHRGWRASYSLLGSVLLILLPVVLLLPWNRLAAGHPALQRERRERTGSSGWTLRMALRDRAFWGLFAVFFFTAVAIYATSLQIVAYLVEIGFSSFQAATAFGTLGMLSVFGMSGSGWFADRIGRRKTVSITFGLTLAGIVILFLLAYVPAFGLLAAFVICFGVSQGSRGPVVSALAAQLFPGGGLGGIYGAITLGMGLGAALGSWTSGVLHDITDGYAAGYAFAATAALLGLAQFWLIPPLATGQRDHN